MAPAPLQASPSVAAWTVAAEWDGELAFFVFAFAFAPAFPRADLAAVDRAGLAPVELCAAVGCCAAPVALRGATAVLGAVTGLLAG